MKIKDLIAPKRITILLKVVMTFVGKTNVF